jgi:hypothetical protein
LVLASPAAFADPGYALTFLPDGFVAISLDNQGRVSGSHGGQLAIWSKSGDAWVEEIVPGSLVEAADGSNGSGMTVGWFDVGVGAPDRRAVLYSAGKMTDLNTMIDPAMGWKLVSAMDINDGQQILAEACSIWNDICRPVLLDPVSCVPEPQEALMLVAGLALLCRRRWTGRARAARSPA